MFTNDDKKPPYPGFNIFPTPNSQGQNMGYGQQQNQPYPNPGFSFPGNNPDYSSMQPHPSGYGTYGQNPNYSSSNPNPQPHLSGYGNFGGVPNPTPIQQPHASGYGNYGGISNPTPMQPHASGYGAFGQPPSQPSQYGYGVQPNPPPQSNYNKNNYSNPTPQMSNSTSPYNINDFGPTIRDFPNFDARRDAETLRKAMKGFGTNEKAIIDVLTKRSNRQRQQIAQQFKMLYGKDLINDLKSELSGKFEAVILALMTPTYQYDAELLRRSIKGLGTDEDLLIEILCSRNPADIRQIKQVYQQMYNRDLEKDIINDTSGHFRRLLVSLATGMRDENNNVDMGLAKRDAEALIQAGVKKIGTDESTFNAVLASRSFPQLRATIDTYRQLTGHTLEQAIRSEMSGDLAAGMIAVAKCAYYRPAYFAERLYFSMKGMGTNDDMLIRTVVTRCEVDMSLIRSEFQRMYGKSLESFIAGDCSGDYKNVLISLVQGNF